MIRPNPGGISTRNPVSMLSSNVPKSKANISSLASTDHYGANNVNVTRGKRGISALGGRAAVLDQSMQNASGNSTRYSLMENKNAHISSQPAF